MKKVYVLTGLVLVAALMFGCSTAQKKPDWVLKGGGAFKQEAKVFYGVGIAEGITSEALRRTTADNRAIGEISKQVSTVSTSLMKDYMSSAYAPESDQVKGEQYIENTAKTFTKNTLAGVRIVDRWDNGKVAYSLATLDLEELKGMADQIQTMSETMKNYIKENAEKAFQSLEEEEAKY
ncbi:MAG: hypothetical protein ABH857_05745 [Elusimicrobiota bacterium]